MTAAASTRRTWRRRPSQVRTRVHWVVLATTLALLGAALVFHGYAHRTHSTADAATPAGAASAVPEGVREGGPVLAADGDDVRSAAPRPGTVALTFDDGPDPVWTPRILDVLAEHGVHATFFVEGAEVLAHPDLARRIVDEGHEIGIHSFNHADLARTGDAARDLQLALTQRAIQGAAGVTASLFRPPYSATAAAVDDATWDTVESAAADGYLTVLSTADSRDWQNPGADAIAEASMPDSEAGEIVLLHDGGGDRTQTVDALADLLPRLDRAGVEVTTVSDAVGMGPSQTAATPVERAAGTALIAGLAVSDVVIAAIGIALAVSAAIILVRAALVIGAAVRHVRRVRRAPVWPETVTDPVSVIVPAYNESAGIEAAVRSIAASTHEVEIIVVDDGSTDGTADLVEALALPRVRVIRQPNAGKPAALQTGLRAASHELIVMVDGDTVFEPGTVHRLVQPFADPVVGAVSGNTKVANRRGLLGAWQHIEYVVGFNLDRRLFDVAECMPTVPGAIGGFRRSVLQRVGGVSEDTLAEDTDLTMAIGRDGWRVVYQEDAIAWTEAPASLGALWKQRYRWCYGTLQAMFKHRRAVFEGGSSGKLGRRGLVYLLVLQVLLPLLAPVVDLFALYGILALDPLPVIGVWLAFLLVQLLMAVFAFALDRESPKALWALPLQQIVYRQLMYLVVIQSVFTAVAGTHLRWHRMERYGSLRAPGAPVA